MTLDRPVRDVAQLAFDVDVVPDEIVVVLEEDEQLAHLCDAVRSLDMAERLSYDAEDAVDPLEEHDAVLDLATERAETLALNAGVHPAVDGGETDD
jgi:hypothetical protein